MTDKSREAFEKWGKEWYGWVNTPFGMPVATAFENGWRLSRAALLEELNKPEVEKQVTLALAADEGRVCYEQDAQAILTVIRRIVEQSA